MATRPLYSNCYFGAIYLFLRRKVHKLIAISTNNTYWPWHFVTVNKNNDIIHFIHILPHQDNQMAPWWFLGRFEGIPKDKCKRILKQQKRKVLWTINSGLLIFIILSSIGIIMSIPWIFGWALYPFCWCLYWLRKI